MRSTDFLEAALAVQDERGREYNVSGGERSIGRVIAAFNAITGKDLTEAEGWLFLQTLKDVRQWTASAYHHDSALDSVSYASLKAESLHAAQSCTEVCEAPAELPPVHTWQKGDVVRNVGGGDHWTVGADYRVLGIGHGTVRVSHEGVAPHSIVFSVAEKQFQWVRSGD